MPSPIPPDGQEHKQEPSTDKAAIISKAVGLLKPAAYTPGRLSNLDILERVFPLHRKSVLELVLQGCNGDLVKAIEQFLSAQDTIDAQGKPEHSGKTSARYHPYSTPSWMQGSAGHYGSSMPSTFDLKSAFKPLPMPPISGLHSAFLPGYSGLTSTSALSTSFNPGQYSSPNFGLPMPPASYTGLHGYGGLFGSPFSLLPYRSAEPRDLSKLADRDAVAGLDKK